LDRSVTFQFDAFKSNSPLTLGPDAKLHPDLIDEHQQFCFHLWKQDPSFIPAYFHFCSLCVANNSITLALELGRPVYDHLHSLLPHNFKGPLEYAFPSNQPFYRLAYALALSYRAIRTPEADQQAKQIALRMLEICPDDRLGFKKLLTSLH